MIDLFHPALGEDELTAVAEVFASGWLGSGRRVAEFEARFAATIGRGPDEVQAVTSCTEGLFQAVAALDVRPGDEVVLPAISFVGAAHAARASGATVVLCDVDPVSLNPTRSHVEAVLTDRTRAIIVLHYGGRAGEVRGIADLARAAGIVLIEDAACGLGAAVDGRSCGTLGDVGVWSFDAMKTITTAGDGGMVWCRDPELAEAVRRGVRLGGAATGFEQRTSGGRWWEIDPPAFGRRSAMNDVAAAVGLVQMERLGEFLRRRESIVRRYDEAWSDIGWLRLPPPSPAGSAPTFHWVQTEPGVRDALADHLMAAGVYTSFRYWPLHRTSLYRQPHPLDGADRAAATTLLVPLHQALTDDDVGRVIDLVRSFDPVDQ